MSWSWTILYAGEAEDMRKRMPGHERLLEAIGHGATHVLNHVNYGGVNARRDEERDVIGFYNPPMNTQHRTNAFAGGGWPESFTGFGLLGAVVDRKQ
jgi:hypothetical protein